MAVFLRRIYLLVALLLCSSKAFLPSHQTLVHSSWSTTVASYTPAEDDSTNFKGSLPLRKSLIKRLWTRTQTWRQASTSNMKIEDAAIQTNTHNDHPASPNKVAIAAMPLVSIIDRKTLKVLWNTISQPILACWHHIQTMTPPQQSLLVAAVAVGFILGRVKPFWIRYRSANDIPPSYFVGNTAETSNKGPTLVGRAIKVTDGDTIRFLHQPTPWHPKTLAKKQKLSEYAIPIRICTMDTPETAKFGKQGQPFGEEAKQALQDFLDNRKVYVRLLQKDQYARAVAQVFVKNFWGRPQYADEYMLRQGLAEVYRGGGAVYGPKGLDAYNAMEAEAKQQKVGIWSMKKRESAAEYKKRTKD